MDKMREIAELLEEIEAYLTNPEETTTDAQIQALLDVQKKLSLEIEVCKKNNPPQTPSDVSEDVVDSSDEWKCISKSLHGQTAVEIFLGTEDTFKIILKPKLMVSDTSEEFYVTLTTNESGIPEIIATNLPCFIPFVVRETTDLTKYTLGIIKRLESFLLRKHYIDATQERFSSMLNGPLRSSLAYDFVNFVVSIDTQVSDIHGYVTFRLYYEMDSTEAKDVYIGFRGSQLFVSLVEKDIMEDSKCFQSQNFYDAFCQVFEPTI